MEGKIELDIPVEHEQNIFGQLDQYLRKIERALKVDVVLRDGSVVIQGEEKALSKAEHVFGELLKLSERGNGITEQNVDYLLSLTMEESTVSLAEIDKELLGYTISGKPIRPKTLGQQKYVGQIRKELGFRTGFNILGPLTNPARPTMQLLGVYDDYLVDPLT